MRSIIQNAEVYTKAKMSDTLTLPQYHHHVELSQCILFTVTTRHAVTEKMSHLDLFTGFIHVILCVP